MGSITEAIAQFDELLGRQRDNGLNVRLLQPGELLPSNIAHGLPADLLLPQPDWCWLVERANQPLALLLAAPAQNVAYLMRLAAAENIPPASLVYLFRAALADMLARGYSAYLAHLDLRTKEGASLLRIAKRAGVKVKSECVLIGGSTNIGRW